MNYCGIDISTHNIDAVFIEADSGSAAWHRFTMWGKDAWDRTREVKGTLEEGGFPRLLSDTLAVAIEEPAGKNPGVIFRVQGAVLSQIPVQTLCFPLMPSQWRKLVGLPGNCSKQEVTDWGRWHLLNIPPETHRSRYRMAVMEMPQDAFDALGLALACSKLVQQGEVAA